MAEGIIENLDKIIDVAETALAIAGAVVGGASVLVSTTKTKKHLAYKILELIALNFYRSKEEHEDE